MIRERIWVKDQKIVKIIIFLSYITKCTRVLICDHNDYFIKCASHVVRHAP